jgi:mannosyl-3-phosphoglycerate phosphatase family protein
MMSRIRAVGPRELTLSGTASTERLIVVTDVDAGLFETATYSKRDGHAALDFLAAAGVQLVINSGRTRAEIERLRQTLRLRTPYISEHGSALFLPKGSLPFIPLHAQPALGGRVIEFGRRYHEVVDGLRAASGEATVEVIGFSALTIEDVGRELGVPIVEAQLAKLREYTEIFRIVDEDDAGRSRLLKALRRRGLRCWQLGAHYLVTASLDRAESLELLKAMWTQAWGAPLVIGLADSEDDLGWLRHVNVAVYIPDEHLGVPPRVLRKLPTVHVPRAAGRAGWIEAIFKYVGGLLPKGQAC